MTYPFSVNDVLAAERALHGVIHRTPLLENKDANERLGCRLLIKAECAQRTGAFKIRGAYNCIRQLTEDERARGAITYSSGNHALGVALAARLLRSSALIVMPEDAPPAKVAAVRALGAEIATFDRDREDSDDVVACLKAETGRIVVPPSADPRVLAGAGTVALEVAQQARDLGAELDAMLTPCGGGGLTASSAVVMCELSPRTSVYAVEPELFDDTRRSLEKGERVQNPVGIRTICDSIMTPTPNSVTFPINLDLLAGGLTASDGEVVEAMRFAYEHYKIVAEPGGAVAIACVMNELLDKKGKTFVAVVTGGNVDSRRFCRLINDGEG